MTEQAMMVAAGVKKVFRGGDVGGRAVLQDVNFTLRAGEIVACLGKSDALAHAAR